jgi:hypothetical protein
MTVFAQSCGRARRLSGALSMACLLVSINAAAFAASETLTVTLDQATLLKLPEKVATIVIGNPLIADVTVQAGGMVVVTGKGYGITNLIALDRTGVTLVEKNILAQGARDRVVVVYRGVERESYSCTPSCERRITLGDTSPFFDTTLGQVSRNGQAAGGAGTK